MIESPIVIGRGDVILKYPELIETMTNQNKDWLDTISDEPYIAVHLGASSLYKIPPQPELLLRGLIEAGVRHVLLGNERCIVPAETIRPCNANLRLHIETVKRASAFIGTLSCFNAVAQLVPRPSFVLVNRSIKEPLIYAHMAKNRAVVEAWNVGKPIEQIYREAVEWAKP